MIDLFQYQRRQTSNVHVGAVDIGGNNPVRIQSMTTTNTNDTEACVKQAEDIIKAGGELVRLTTQGSREAENLKNINAGLRNDGHQTPLVADVHFNPHVADVAALYAEGVRINPGNYVDPARKFIQVEYTDEEYEQELKKIEERFVPFLNICKEHHTAIRIGVNHGSLSDRIRNRYGDTPAGIVESCMEFLRICKKENFSNVVISIKSSNTVEEPAAEIPVAKHLVDYIGKKSGHIIVPGEANKDFNWISPTRRNTQPVINIGGNHVPVVISSCNAIKGANAVSNAELTPDYIYIGSKLPKQIKMGQCYIVDYNAYQDLNVKPETTGAKLYPIFPVSAMPFIGMIQAELKFLVLEFGTPAAEYLACLKAHPEIVVICVSNQQNRLACQRALVHEMMNHGLHNPVIFAQMYEHTQAQKSDFQLEAAADMGALMMDGLVDGIWLMNNGNLAQQDVDDTAFNILQAGRLRTTKTEYISCPGCGRTLYDLRETIAKIREATKEMKGLKIGIMGCIVNGPGEMADADYGYVGAGVNRVSLYRKQECIEKNIPEEFAVEHLLKLIESDKNKN